MKSLAERFNEKVDKDGPTPNHCPELGPCHLWTGAKTPQGYGRMRAITRNEGSHRIAFFLKHGRWPVPHGLHHCDNPSCVNGNHIYEGTKKDNARDCANRGRNTSQKYPGIRAGRNLGESNGSAKLTLADAAEIRSSAESRNALATRYGISTTTVYRIRKGRRWRAALVVTPDVTRAT